MEANDGKPKIVEDAVERLEDFPVDVLHRLHQHVEKRFVIFVDEDNAFLTRLLVHRLEDFGEAQPVVLNAACTTVLLLPLTQYVVQIKINLTVFLKPSEREIHMEHRILHSSNMP